MQSKLIVLVATIKPAQHFFTTIEKNKLRIILFN